MRITGTLHSIGAHRIAGDPTSEDYPSLEEFTGILITADEATLRAASNLLCCTVDIYPHPVNELIAGECTPENYAHAMARLAHAEAATPMADHLAREVRSSQALSTRVKELEQAAKTETPLAEINRSLQDMIDARDKSHHEIGQYLLTAHKAGEVDPDAVAILDGYHIADREVDDGEHGESTLEAALRLLKLAKQRGAFMNTTERDAAWRKYLDLRKQVRISAAAERPDDEVHALMAEAKIAALEAETRTVKDDDASAGD